MQNSEVSLGRLLVAKGLISEQKLIELIKLQQRQKGTKKLGNLLLEQKLVEPEQLKAVLAEQRARLQRTATHTTGPQEAAIVGRRAVATGLLTEAQLNECLRLQALEQAKGRPVRLGEILVRKKLITSAQLFSLLQAQEKRLFACPSCRKQYNVVVSRQAPMPTCPACRTALQPVATGKKVGAVGTLLPEEVAQMQGLELAEPPKAPSEVVVEPRPKPAYAFRRQASRVHQARPVGWKFVAAACVVLVLVVAAFLLKGRGQPANDGDQGGRVATSQQAGSGQDEQWTADLLENQWQELGSFLDTYRDSPAIQTRKLLEMQQVFAGSKYEEQYSQRLEESQRKLNLVCEKVFKRLVDEANALAAEQRYQAALEKVLGFPAEIDVAGTWNVRCNAERERLSQQAFSEWNGLKAQIEQRLAQGDTDAVWVLVLDAERIEFEPVRHELRLLWERVKDKQATASASTTPAPETPPGRTPPTGQLGTTPGTFTSGAVPPSGGSSTSGMGSSAGTAGLPALEKEGICQICLEKKKMECFACLSQGSFAILCGRCNGTKVVPCPICKGTPTSTCEACQGSGRHNLGPVSGYNEATGHGGSADNIILCRPCNSKGFVTCKACNGAGKQKCVACKDGKVQIVCALCKGDKTLPCANFKKHEGKTGCALCGGKSTLRCPACEGKKNASGDCRTCGRSGTVWCDACRARGKVLCGGCAGKGQLGNSGSCTQCKGKGELTCTTCNERGRKPCPECKDKASAVKPCAACTDGTVPCPLCRGILCWSSQGVSKGAIVWLVAISELSPQLYRFLRADWPDVADRLAMLFVDNGSAAEPVDYACVSPVRGEATLAGLLCLQQPLAKEVTTTEGKRFDSTFFLLPADWAKGGNFPAPLSGLLSRSKVMRLSGIEFCRLWAAAKKSSAPK